MSATRRGAVAIQHCIVLGWPKVKYSWWPWCCVWLIGFISGICFTSWLLLCWIFMHISLQRYCECHPQLSCIFAFPICGRIQVNIFTFLQTSDSFRVSLSCVLLLADRRDILLLVTERRLDIQLSSWSVVTPPLAAWSVDQNDGAEAD